MKTKSTKSTKKPAKAPSRKPAKPIWQRWADKYCLSVSQGHQGALDVPGTTVPEWSCNRLIPMYEGDVLRSSVLASTFSETPEIAVLNWLQMYANWVDKAPNTVVPAVSKRTKEAKP